MYSANAAGQTIGVSDAGQEQVERPARVITPEEVIIPHQPVINPTELGRDFPESLRIEDTLFHAKALQNSFLAPCPKCRAL